MIPIYTWKPKERASILARREEGDDLGGAVSEIIARVREEGDKALRAYSREFDGVELKTLEISSFEIEDGFRRADAQLVEILFMAAERIAAFHQKQIRQSFLQHEEPGVLMGQKIVPLERVGLYVPGGTASYPSSVLMNAIPAKLAGVSELIMVTPPGEKGIAPAILAAAKIAGVSRVFQIGGAQAVAALAYGTESVPRVDKIVGPGNRYVAAAKQQLYGQVDIDMIAGPSEILIIADAGANPAHLAADLLAQAEHDVHAASILLTECQSLAEAVQAAIEVQLQRLPRAEIARASIEQNGKIIVVKDLQEALALSNELAPEHLELCVENPFDYLSEIKHAGSVFLGRHCPEALGDYFAGPNHTLPTGGSARFFSPLSVDDFVKKIQYTYFTKAAFQKVAPTVSYFARFEGLAGHARSVEIRLEGDEG